MVPWWHHTREQITLTIDDDVLAAAKALAARNRTSLGKALSELARRGFRTFSPAGEQGDRTVFTVTPDADAITLGDVNRSLEDWP